MPDGVETLPNDELALRLYRLVGELPEADSDLVLEACMRLCLWQVPVEQIAEVRRKLDLDVGIKPKPAAPLKRQRVRL